MYKKTKVVIEIDIPEGATHYRGYPGSADTNDVEFLKSKKEEDGWVIWFYWNNAHNQWMLECQGREPNWLKSLDEVIYKEQ